MAATINCARFSSAEVVDVAARPPRQLVDWIVSTLSDYLFEGRARVQKRFRLAVPHWRQLQRVTNEEHRHAQPLGSGMNCAV
jgi:hypothetical protein